MAVNLDDDQAFADITADEGIQEVVSAHVVEPAVDVTSSTTSVPSPGQISPTTAAVWSWSLGVDEALIYTGLALFVTLQLATVWAWFKYKKVISKLHLQPGIGSQPSHETKELVRKLDRDQATQRRL